MALAEELDGPLLHRSGRAEPARHAANGQQSLRTSVGDTKEKVSYALATDSKLQPVKLGLLSDTHGLLRPEALAALEGCDHILHMGDVGGNGILKDLARIAPVHAVRGNVDRTGSCSRLPETDVLLFEGHYLYLLHDRAALHLDPAAAKFSAVLYGHTHRPHIEWNRDVLYFNPGSCGPRRFELPVSVGTLTIAPDEKLQPEIVHLDIPTK